MTLLSKKHNDRTNEIVYSSCMGVRFLFLLPLMFVLVSCLGLGSQKPAPVATYGQKSGPGSAGVHNVLAGDTLFTIAQDYRLPMRDIAIINKLRPPFRLSAGQRLYLPPPQEYRVQQGDTIYNVSLMFGVNASEIARLNNLTPPYALRAGQVLRLPSVTRKTQFAKNNLSSSVVNKPAKIAAVDKGVPLDAPENNKQTAILSVGTLRTDDLVIPVEPKLEPVEPANPALSQSVVKLAQIKTPARASSKFLMPVKGQIISDYGAKTNGLHNDGVNILAAKGTKVGAAENGVVAYTGNALKGSGNLVLIRHEDQWMTAYAHLDSINVTKGQIVKRGEKIGSVGQTGLVDQPQLHFEVRRSTTAMNPKKYTE